MLAMIGAFLGWLVLVTLVFSSVAGSVIGLLVIAFRKGRMKYPALRDIPRAALVSSLAGGSTNWYVGFSMTKAGPLLLLLTAIVAALAGILAFAVAKFFAAARAATRAGRDGGSETAFMAAAMEEALQKMRAQERAMQARAEASERLSGEIIASMTSGLLVVSQEGSCAR
jgi:hypothetical protein